MIWIENGLLVVETEGIRVYAAPTPEELRKLADQLENGEVAA